VEKGGRENKQRRVQGTEKPRRKFGQRRKFGLTV
jgi:hypothetical protein